MTAVIQQSCHFHHGLMIPPLDDSESSYVANAHKSRELTRLKLCGTIKEYKLGHFQLMH